MSLSKHIYFPFQKVKKTKITKLPTFGMSFPIERDRLTAEFNITPAAGLKIDKSDANSG